MAGNRGGVSRPSPAQLRESGRWVGPTAETPKPASNHPPTNPGGSCRGIHGWPRPLPLLDYHCCRPGLHETCLTRQPKPQPPLRLLSPFFIPTPPPLSPLPSSCSAFSPQIPRRPRSSPPPPPPRLPEIRRLRRRRHESRVVSLPFFFFFFSCSSVWSIRCRRRWVESGSSGAKRADPISPSSRRFASPSRGFRRRR